MKTSSSISAKNPFLLFWLGVLTGALMILGILFFRTYGGDYQTSVLKFQSAKKIQTPVQKKPGAKKRGETRWTVPDTNPAIPMDSRRGTVPDTNPAAVR